MSADPTISNEQRLTAAPKPRCCYVLAMPSRKRRYSTTSPTYGPKKFGAAVRRYLKEHELLISAEKHQDFPWLVGELEDWLGDNVFWVDLEGLSVRAQNTLRKMALESLQTLYNIRRREYLVIDPDCMWSVMEDLIPSDKAKAQFLHALREQCLVYLYQTLGSEPVQIPPVTKPDEKRVPNRKRSELPDPEQPAWATVNRRRSTKFQIPCRVEWHVKGRIEAAAYKLGMSQAEWIENAIVHALLDHGYELPRTRRYNRKRNESSFARRTPRLELPVPGISRHASVNRADKSTTVRMCKGLAKQIDDDRGRESRSQWLNEVVHAFVNSREELPPGGVEASGPLTEVIGLRFDPEFYAKLEPIIAKSGRSKSDWFRGAALWWIKMFENPYT